MAKQQRIINYPQDLLDDIITSWSGSEIDIYGRSFVNDWDYIVENFEENWKYIKRTLLPREEKTIELYYKEGLTLKEIGKEFGVSSERIRQVLYKALRRLKHPSRLKVFLQGIKALQEKETLKSELELEIAKLSKKLYEIKNNPKEFLKDYSEKKILNAGIDELELSLRTYNCLRRAKINNIYDLTQKTEKELMKIRNLGKKSCREIVLKLKENGYFLKGQKDD